MQKIKFRFNDKHIDSFNTPGVLNLMFLDLTNQCNLKCQYCFNHHKLDLAPVHFEIELLEKILKSKVTKNVRNWFLSGGEPLCYPYLDEALEMFQTYGHRPKIATNGIKLKPAVVDKWVSLGVQSVQISFDTLQPSLFMSLNAGSKEDHQSILDNMRYAIQSPLRVVVSSVLSKANAHEIKDIMLYCYDLGIDSYTLYPNVPATTTNTDLVIPFSQQLDLFNDLIKSYKEICSTRIIDISIPCLPFSDVYPRWKEMVSIRSHPCGAGQFNLKITSEGLVSTCICQDADEFIVGSLFDSDIDEIWSSKEIKKFRSIYESIPTCRVCQYRSECRGGCRNEAYVYGKDGILSNDPHCEFFNNHKKVL